MSEEPNDKGRGSGWWVWLALLVILPVLYVLSIGPVALFIDRTGRGEEVAVAVYAPIEWLHRNTSLREPIESYVNFWAGLGGGRR